MVVNLLDENAAATSQSHGILADVNCKDDRFQTPLHSSIFSGDINISKLLIERFAEVNAQDDESKTPLHLACMLGNLSMVKLLMARPECVATLQDKKGDTALHIACSHLNDPVIRFLKENEDKAMSMRNLDGKTPVEILSYKAKQAGQFARFQELIEEMGSASGNGEEEKEPQDRGRQTMIRIQDADEGTS